MLVLTEDSDGVSICTTPFLLGDRDDGNKLMVWSLDLLLYQVIPERKLFSPRFKRVLAQMKVIRAVLGFPPELVVKEWLKHPNTQDMLSGVQESPSFLVDKFNAGFSPGAEHLSGSIRHMPNMMAKADELVDGIHEGSRPRTVFNCYCIQRIASSANFTSPNYSDSGESLFFVNEPDNKLAPPGSIKSSIS
jgi:hypothetical protein